MKAAFAVTVTVAALALAACGPSQDNTSSSTPSSGGASKDTDYSVAATYIGGALGAADKTKTPITLGWVNENGGSTSTPEATSALNAAVNLINDKLGGIDGHPVKIDSCLVKSSAEEGQACAQKMYNDKDVQVVLTGATSLASDALHSTLADSKPIVGSTPSGPADLAAKNSFYIGAGPFGTAADISLAINVLKAKSIAVIAPNFPGTTVAMQGIDAAAKKAGATVKLGSYQLGSADVTPAVVASGASSADAVLALDPSDTGCIAIAKAIQQSGVTTPVISNASCAADSVAKGLGGELPKWTFAQPTLIPSLDVTPEKNLDQTAVFLAAMKEYSPSSTVAGLAGSTFAQTMYVAKILDQVGADKLSSDAISAALQASTGPVFLSTPTLKFGTSTGPAIGSFAALFYTYKGDGKWTAENDGNWVS